MGHIGIKTVRLVVFRVFVRDEILASYVGIISKTIIYKDPYQTSIMERKRLCFVALLQLDKIPTQNLAYRYLDTQNNAIFEAGDTCFKLIILGTYVNFRGCKYFHQQALRKNCLSYRVPC